MSSPPHPSSSRWHAVQKRSDRSALRLSVLVISAMITIAVGVMVPLTLSLRASERQIADSTYEQVTQEVTSVLIAEKEVAAQLPSRTQIRVALAEYRAGRLTAEEYQAFAGSRLADALRVSTAMRGVVRLDHEHRPVAFAGEPELLAAAPTECAEIDHNASAVRLVFEPCATPGNHVWAIAPIRDSDGTFLGTDLIAMSDEPIVSSVDAAATRFDGSVVELGYTDGTSYWVVAISEPVPSDQENRILSRTSDILPGWQLTWSVRRSDVHYASTRVLLAVFWSSALGIGVVSLMAVHAIQTSRRRTDEELGVMAEIITERTGEIERLLEQRTLLVRESHHRVRNELVILRSLLALTQEQDAAHGADARLTAAASRIDVILSLYEELSGAEDFTLVRLDRFLERVVTAAPGSVRVGTVDLAEVTVTRDKAVPLGIVLNELIVDSIKYARAPDWLVEVRMVRAEDEIVLVYRDHGDGIPTDVLRGAYGFGLNMISALVDQVGGTMTLSNDAGATVTIVVSVASS